MRIIYWLFAVGVALFISGIGFIIASARTVRAATPATAAAPTTPVASVDQIMNGITAPNAIAIYNAVGTIIDEKGVTELEPRTDEEWTTLGYAAAALIESGNLLLVDGRRLDDDGWVKATTAMMDAGQVTLKAVQAKNKQGVLESATVVNDTCDACHATYRRE